MKKLRLLHRYLGIFFSPIILFFTLSGLLQTFNLHQSDKNSSYVPPRWVVLMAQVHKKQTFSLPTAKSKSAEPAVTESHNPKLQQQPAKMHQASLSLKIFIAVMSIGLILTALLGIYMALRYGGSRRIVWGLLLLGTLMPMAMLFL
jgi:hypothetical protein